MPADTLSVSTAQISQNCLVFWTSCRATLHCVIIDSPDGGAVRARLRSDPLDVWRGFATVPAYLADIFGTQFVGAIHGRLLTARSTAGIVGPVVVNYNDAGLVFTNRRLTCARRCRPSPPRLPRRRRGAEDAWNTRDPERVSLAYTVDSRWRNRGEIFQGREATTCKWQRELDYCLVREVWAFDDNRIAVRSAYEWHDDIGNWFRSYGNENWEFDNQGLMRARHASINDRPIRPDERKYHWPLGRRPDDHPSLSDLGL
jgi:nuclear transport factor 2 (NTF2) superfamily protein